MHAFIALLKRFHSDERGIFAVIFGVMALVLVALAGAAVDYTSMETARTRAQIALDSAALGLGPKIYEDDVTEEELIADAQAVVRERLANVPQVIVNVTAAEINDDAGTLRLTGDVTVPMAFVQLVGIQTLTAGIVSEATKGSINLEVAVALDVTYSMGPNDGEDMIPSLEAAISSLIDKVVKEDQDPTYSKMAIVPYSMGVNVGDYANAVRGAPRTSTNIDAASWGTATGLISKITKASPGVVTSAGHGLQTGDRIVITGVKGMTQINNPQPSNLNSGNKAYRVVRINSDTFSLQRYSNGAAIATNIKSGNNDVYGNYTNNSGTWRKCFTSSCEVRVTTATNHDIEEDEYIRVTGVQGMTQINTSGTSTWKAKSVTDTTLILEGTFGPDFSNYSSGTNDAVWCTTNEEDERPCQYLRYTAADNSTVRLPQITKCVTERVTDRYTNEPPSTTWIGRHYPNGNSLNNCLSNEIIPLTSDKITLHDDTEDFVAAGSTSGHIGLAWAWYLLSHEFTSEIFEADAEGIAANPTIEDADPVMKVVVLMTDGLFNTNYCGGVVAKNADSVAGQPTQRINCNGVNSTTQGEELCDAIDEDGIIIYTVAFALQEIGDEDDRDTVRQMLVDCANADGGFYEATNGEGLLAAFDAIARNINDLRLSL